MSVCVTVIGMKIDDAIKEALKAYLNPQWGGKVVSVDSFRDYTKTSGYCETCEYTEAVVEVKFTTRSGKGPVSQTWEYVGSFRDLIRTLDAAEV